MKYLIIFFFSLSFGHLIDGKLDKEDINYIKQKKVINVCINPDWAPIEFREDGIPKGISIDILKIISKRIGLKLNFIYTDTWKKSQEYLKNGKCDITPTAIKTYKREKYAIFTKPYLNYDLAIITTQDKPYVTDISAIIDKSITRKKGSGLITKLKRLYPNIQILQANNFVEMFKLVADKKVYVTIAALPVFAYYKKRYNLYNLKIVGFTGWKYPLRIMVNKNETKLRNILDDELKLISPETTQKIYEKWIIQTKPEFNYKFFIIFGIILLIVSLWLFILYKKNKKLKELSEIKSKFLSNMSHELRTPLNSLMGFIQIIEKNPKECEKYLPLVKASAETILTEIDDILNFDRLQKKEIKLKNIEFTKQELKSLLSFCEFEAKKKGLKVDYKDDLPEFLYGDIDKIRDVLVHLIDNAIKFTKEGKIEIILKYENEKLFVSIKDTGIGIPQNRLKEIFKEFKQLDERINKKYQGLGVGLSISQKLVKILGGELKVKSEVNKGSEFYFEIPIKKVEKKEKKINIKGKILVAEDNKANQMFMQVLLKQLNINFDIAENGKIAFELYKNYHYPIILMDINMPVMDGIEATKKIREYEKQNNLKPSKIIAVTANAIDGDEERFLEAGMDGYIPKPIDIEKLKKLLN